MPNGKPGDHPLTDLVAHGLHLFPSDMEAMSLELHERRPEVLEGQEARLCAWESGEQLEEGRQWLRDRLAEAGT